MAQGDPLAGVSEAVGGRGDPMAGMGGGRGNPLPGVGEVGRGASWSGRRKRRPTAWSGSCGRRSQLEWEMLEEEEETH